MKIRLFTCIILLSLLIAGCKDGTDETKPEAVPYIYLYSPVTQYSRIYPDTDCQIKWDSNISGLVQIDITENGQTVFTVTEEAPIDSTYIWHVPKNMEYFAHCKFKVTSKSKPEILSSSQYEFELGNPPPQEYVKVIKPNGGESYTQTSQIKVEWEKQPAGRVIIKIFYANIEVGYIPAPAESEDTYTYTNLSDFPPGDYYRFKVITENKPNVFDFSDDYFSLAESETEE